MWKYCPLCGSKLETSEAFVHGKCPSCGQTWYKNPSPTSTAIIIRDRKILLAKRAIDPKKGFWDIPGGFINEGETPEEALTREVKEELGVDIITAKYFGAYINPEYIYHNITIKTLDLAYLVIVSDKVKFRPADDVSSVEWFSLDKKSPEFAFKSMARVFADLQKSNIQNS